MKLISLLVAGACFVESFHDYASGENSVESCYSNELVVCPTTKKKAFTIINTDNTDGFIFKPNVRPKAKIKCPRKTVIEMSTECYESVVGRVNNDSHCDGFNGFQNYYAQAPSYSVDNTLATNYYKTKCDGKRKCKISYKKDTKKLRAPKASHVEINLNWECRVNARGYKKKAIKKQRKSAAKVGTTASFESFWQWYGEFSG